MPQDEINRVDPDPEAVFKLLRKLATDDVFRARLEADPQAVLAERGIPVPAGALEGPITLPTRDEIIAVAGAARSPTVFRVEAVLRRAGVVSHSDSGAGGIRPASEYGEDRPDEFGSRVGEFGPPLEEGERAPAEFGPPEEERERPPAEFGDASAEFGPPAENAE